MGRPSKPESEKARNAGLTLYPQEIEAMNAAAKARRLKTSSDFVRVAVIKMDDPRTRGKIQRPRRIPSSKQGRSLAPDSRPQPPA